MRIIHKFCRCGSPQSFPIPHEHDQTKREKQIIKYYADRETHYGEMLEHLENVIDEYESDGGIMIYLFIPKITYFE